MSFSAKMMNLGMRKVYDYLEKDPKTNLPKLMEMIDKVLPESVYAPQRKVFREILEDQDNNWFELIESVWTDIDPQIIRKFFENFIMNANLDWAEKREKVMEEYHCMFRGQSCLTRHQPAICTVPDAGRQNMAIA